ncbi:MAG TPA: glycosyltransferase, partial [Chroococcales cyanobacterium]
SAKIEFAGTFPNAELGRVLENIDVLVVPSRWYENTPLVMQSALATKTPLIVTNLGGMSELVRDGVNGLLFELNDYQSLSRCLKKVIDTPGLLTEFMSNIAPERTVSQMVDDIEAVYEKVLNPSLARQG